MKKNVEYVRLEKDVYTQLMEGFSLEQMKADIADNIDQLIERKARFDSNVFGKE